MPDRERTATGISEKGQTLVDAAMDEQAIPSHMVEGGPPIYCALLEYVAALEAERDRLNVLEEIAGRELWVREEPDRDICNVYLRYERDALAGGVFSSLREAADAELRRRSDAR